MKPNRILLIIFLSLINSLISCDSEYNECEGLASEFVIDGLSGQPYHMVEGTPKISSETAELSFNAFFIRYEFSVTELSHHSSSNRTLMADCAGPTDKIGVDQVIIEAMGDYNSNYKAGDSLNDIAEVFRYTRNADDFNNYQSLSDYIADNSEGIQNPFFDLKFSEAPTSGGPQTFKLTYILNDGQRFEANVNQNFNI